MASPAAIHPRGGVISDAPIQDKHEYTVSTSGQQVTVTGLSQAVTTARDFSAHGRASVERDDRRISMRYRGGSLQEYRFDTR